MIEFFYLPGSAPSRAVHMILEELKLPFTGWPIDKLYSDEAKLGEFTQGNPDKTFPTISDDGFFLWESRVILSYLTTKYGKGREELYPTTPIETRAIIDRYLHFDLGTLFSSLVDYFQPQLVDRTPPNPKAEEKLKAALDKLNGYLEGKEFVAGGQNLTIADIAIFASVTELKGIDYSYTEWTNITNWAAKLEKALPYHNEVNEEPIAIFREFAKGLMGPKPDSPAS